MVDLRLPKLMNSDNDKREPGNLLSSCISYIEIYYNPNSTAFARYIREYSRQLGQYQIEPDSEALRLAILELNNTFHFITDHAFDGQSEHFDAPAF